MCIPCNPRGGIRMQHAWVYRLSCPLNCNTTATNVRAVAAKTVKAAVSKLDQHIVGHILAFSPFTLNISLSNNAVDLVFKMEPGLERENSCNKPLKNS